MLCVDRDVNTNVYRASTSPSRSTAVVSVRIDNKTKKPLERAGINIGKELKRFIEGLAWNVQLSEGLKVLEKELKELPGATGGFSKESVREDREGH